MSKLSINRDECTLLVVDIQGRLMPAIADADNVIKNAQRLIDAAAILDVPVVVTEQNPDGLGTTTPELRTGGAPVISKMTFDATRAPGFDKALGVARSVFVVAGCEAHVCVTQTVLGLLSAGHKVYLVADALVSRDPGNRAAAIERLRGHGAEIVTTEMVVFEWADSAEHPNFRELVGLVK